MSRPAGPGGAGRTRVVLSIFDDLANPHYGGGGPRVVRAMAQRLAEEHDVLVVTAGRRLARRPVEGVPHLFLPLLWAGPRTAQALWALALPLAVLLVHHDAWVESFTPPVSSNLVPLLTRRPVVGLAQALAAREVVRRYRVRLPLHQERRLLRLYRDVVVLNEHDRAQVAAASPRTRAHLVPNGVPAPPTGVRTAGAGEHLLFLGRVDVRQKGLDLLVAAVAGAGSGCLPVVLAGAGRAREEQRLRALLAGAGGRVTWVGAVSGQRKEDLLQRAAAVVVPSREESFCLTALEALVRARPVVVFDLPQLAWVPREGAEVVPRFDVTALREALERLSADASRRDHLGAAGALAVAGRTGRRALDPVADLVRGLLGGAR